VFLFFIGMLAVAQVRASEAQTPDHGAVAAATTSAAAARKDDNAGVVIAFLEARIRRDPDDITALNRLASLYLRQLRETGDFSHLEQAAVVARQSLAAVPGEVNAGGLAAQARVDFESHRFAAARDGAKRLTATAPDKAEGFMILGDALLELGEPDAALAAWQEMARRGDDGLDLQMRRARVHWVRGELDAAREGFSKAIELAKNPLSLQPQAALWCRIQRGQLAFSLGDWQRAEEDYNAAREIAPEHYAVLDHLAELRAAQKQFPEAVALYQRVIERTNRAEFMQALGDVCAAAGQPAEAKQWHDRALAVYLKSAEAGNAPYFHHLAGFYSDSEPDPVQALKWARRDLEMRQSVFAYDALAWALYQNGEWKPAAEAAEKALALNTPDAHLIFHAGMIFSRAGDLQRGGELLRRVAKVNPHYFDSFHVHR
jgi:tetratricopeptide (TPR) repeat protein